MSAWIPRKGLVQLLPPMPRAPMKPKQLQFLKHQWHYETGGQPWPIPAPVKPLQVVPEASPLNLELINRRFERLKLVNNSLKFMERWVWTTKEFNRRRQWRHRMKYVFGRLHRVKRTLRIYQGKDLAPVKSTKKKTGAKVAVPAKKKK
eukprot:TRINITY_DN17065_c0_g1_i1.p1 TRINITY_DN17065_c0_g1~~TRINITY_DN17065_c0_g1_i1.p1  ORF type:complete len:159 (-),score=35.62 TRINITY_DN17065_c0_g1_i1:11-454(-)